MNNITGTLTIESTIITGTVTTEEVVVNGTVGLPLTSITGTLNIAAGPKGEDGEPGAPGDPGAPGVGVPVGGGAGQVLAKVDATDYNTEWVEAPTGGGGGGTTVKYLTVDVLGSNMGNDLIYPAELKFIIPAGKHCTIEALLMHVSLDSSGVVIGVDASTALGGNYFIQNMASGIEVGQSILPGGGFFPPPPVRWAVPTSTPLPRGFYLVGTIMGGVADSEFSIGFTQNITGPAQAGLKIGSYVKYTITD